MSSNLGGTSGRVADTNATVAVQAASMDGWENKEDWEETVRIAEATTANRAVHPSNDDTRRGTSYEPGMCSACIFDSSSQHRIQQSLPAHMQVFGHGSEDGPYLATSACSPSAYWGFVLCWEAWDGSSPGGREAAAPPILEFPRRRGVCVLYWRGI